MQEAIKSGSILVKKGTPFPEGFQLESASYSPGGNQFQEINLAGPRFSPFTPNLDLEERGPASS